MAFGVTDQGFNLKRLADVNTSLRERLQNVRDPLTNEPLNLDDENDPFTQIVNAAADEIALTWEQAQVSYNSSNPASATGAALAAVSQINGVRRQEGTRSFVTLTITGTAGTVIPVQSRVSDFQNANVFLTRTAVTIANNGEVQVLAEAENIGPVNPDLDTLTRIVTPVAGWQSVTNPIPAVLGSAAERDVDLRARRDQSTELPSRTQVESLRAGLLAIEGVTFARVLQNLGLSADSRSIPGKSIAAIVVGGNQRRIAQEIFLRSNANTHGNTAEIFTDTNGEQYTINFFRPTDVEIFINISIEVTSTAVYPTNGDDLIRQAIVSYAESGAAGVGIQDGFEQNGFQPGASIDISRLYTPINSVPGHRVSSLEIGLSSGATSAQNLAINFDQVAVFDASRITITRS